jgi:hypothetical protein
MGATTFSKTALILTTLGLTIPSITILRSTLFSTDCHYFEQHTGECRYAVVIMLCAIRLDAVMLNVVACMGDWFQTRLTLTISGNVAD